VRKDTFKGNADLGIVDVTVLGDLLGSENVVASDHPDANTSALFIKYYILIRLLKK